MLVRTPDYYSDFKCIAGECTDTCCAGWQVDVDDRSFEYYKTITGDFGDRLHSVMIDGKKGAEGQFRIRDDGRCPFLNDDNMCDLYTALGQDALCITCDQYPRYTCEFGNLRETGIALSCKTAAELILKENRTPGFTEYNDDEAFPALNNIDGLLYVNLMKARSQAFFIVWDRNYGIGERMARLLQFTDNIQDCIKKPDDMSSVIERWKNCPQTQSNTYVSGHEKIRLYKSFWRYYLKQVIIKKEWVELALMVQCKLYNDDYEKTENDFFKAYCHRDYEYENIITYFIFRYFMKGVFDRDVLTKVKMAVISTLIIMQCDMAVWKNNGGEFTLSDQIEVTHLYSREVEHSEENFASLCRLFSRKKQFNLDNLIRLTQIPAYIEPE